MKYLSWVGLGLIIGILAAVLHFTNLQIILFAIGVLLLKMSHEWKEQ